MWPQCSFSSAVSDKVMAISNVSSPRPELPNLGCTLESPGALKLLGLGPTDLPGQGCGLGSLSLKSSAGDCNVQPRVRTTGLLENIMVTNFFLSKIEANIS